MERLLAFTLVQQLREQQQAPAAAAAATAGSSSHKRKAACGAASRAKRRRKDGDAESDSDESSEGDDSDPAGPSMQEILQHAFNPSAAAGDGREPLQAGIIALQLSSAGTGGKGAELRRAELTWAHSTPHFAVAYMAKGEHPHAFVSSTGVALAAAAAAPAAASPKPTLLVAGQRFRFSAP